MTSIKLNFQEQIQQGIPQVLPELPAYPANANRAPKRKDVLSLTEKKLAISNALRYFPTKWHDQLAKEFWTELKEYGRIYMYRFQPRYEMYARPITEYPAKTVQAASIML
ncbi:MAG: urocanate hydratase, partial [Saprospiraceae bacterium]